MDASNLLKPALQSGQLRCMGSTTYKEYRQHFEKDRALARRFQKIDVNEPSIPDTIKILMGLKPYFEEFHKVKYSDDAIKSAVELSARHMNDRKLPDKAIDVIDESGASMMLLAARPAQRDHRYRRGRRSRVAHGAHSSEIGLEERQRNAGVAARRFEARRVRSEQCDRSTCRRHQDGACGSA